jgi:hypothetical protein
MGHDFDMIQGLVCTVHHFPQWTIRWSRALVRLKRIKGKDDFSQLHKNRWEGARRHSRLSWTTRIREEKDCWAGTHFIDSTPINDGIRSYIIIHFGFACLCKSQTHRSPGICYWNDLDLPVQVRWAQARWLQFQGRKSSHWQIIELEMTSRKHKHHGLRFVITHTKWIF